MKKKVIKLIILSSLIIQSSIIFCQNYLLNINLNNGSTVTFAVDDIKRIEFDNVASNDDDNQIQQANQKFKLMQNTPNPFNPTTVIEYQIPKTENVTVRIYNIKGQLIDEILNETQNEGVHQVIWNGTDRNNESVASGIYLYSVKSGNSVLSKKMLLLK